MEKDKMAEHTPGSEKAYGVKRCRTLKEWSTNKKIAFCVILVYLLHICTAIATNRFYYADGVFFFVDVLNTQKALLPFSNDEAVFRIGINFVNQLPTIICLKLGINNINFLSIVFGSSLFFNNIIGALFCWRKCKSMKNGQQMILFPIAAYAFFCIPSDIFSVNQPFTAFWIYFILFFHIIGDNEKIIDKVILLITLAVSCCSHESFLMVGPLLLVVIAVELASNKAKQKKCEMTLTGLCIAAGIALNAWYMSTHVTLTGDSYFAGILCVFEKQHFFKSNLLISCVGLALVLLCTDKRFNKTWIWGTFLALGIEYVLLTHHYYDQYTPFLEYSIRALITIGMLGGIFLTYLYYKFCDTTVVKSICFENWWRITAIVLVLHCVWQWGNTYAWNQYLSDFKNSLKAEKGFFEAKGQQDPFAWGWNQSSMSLVADGDYVVDVLMKDVAEEYEPHITNDTLWIPFMAVDNAVFDISKLIAYREMDDFTKADCQYVVVDCVDEAVSTNDVTTTIPVVIENNSSEILNQDNLFVSYHIYKEGTILLWDGVRTDIQCDILPGEKVTVELIVHNEGLLSGEYTLVVDLIEEGEYWFIDSGMQGEYLDFSYVSQNVS